MATPRERVLATINHREPDQIAIDFNGHRSSGIMAIAYARLRRYLGLPERPIRVYDFIQQLAIVDDDALDLFGADVLELGRGFAQDAADWSDWVLPDGTPCQIPAYIHPVRQGADWVVYGDEGQVIAIPGHDIDLTRPAAVVGLQNTVAPPFQEGLGQFLAQNTSIPSAHLLIKSFI